MKKLSKFFALTIMCLMTSVVLFGCTTTIDTSTIIGTWVNNDAMYTQIQFIQDSKEGESLSGRISYYIKGDPEPKQTAFWQKAENKYNIDFGGSSAYLAELKNGQMILTEPTSGTSWEYVKKYNN